MFLYFPIYFSHRQVLAMSLYTAVRYHDNMLAFDHYKDGYEDSAEGGSETSGCSQNDSGATLEHLSTNDLQDKSELDLDVEQVSRCFAFVFVFR